MTDAAASAEKSVPLFYTAPVPLNAELHKDWKLKDNRSLAFAAHVNAIPILAEEFISLNGVYPIVFSPGPNPAAVVLTGLRQNENLFVDADGSWRRNAPIPAYVRRFPFLIMETPERDRVLLCVEPGQDAVGPHGTEPLFVDGEASPIAKEVMEFCMNFSRAATMTTTFCQELYERGLLVDQRLDITLPQDQGPVSINGFTVIDEKKLGELPDDVFLEWRKRNWLSLIYAHLASLGRWRILVEMLSDRLIAAKA